MQVTRELLASKILEYLNRKCTANDLAVWAENMMLEGNFQDEYFEVIGEALAEIGLINVKSFEMPISKFLNILKQLNYYTVFGLEPLFDNKNELVYA